MVKDRVALDLPAYDGLLAGHYVRGRGYGRRRPTGTDDWLLVMTLDGEGRFGTSVGEVRARPPSLVLLAPGTPHDYGTAREAGGWEILWVHFHPPGDWLELLQWPTVAPGVHAFEPGRPEMLREAFREVWELSLTSGPRRRWFAMNALERLLLHCEAQLPATGSPMDDRIRAAVEYIHAHLRETLTIAELGARANLSPSRFAHLFREQIGLSPRQYVILQRLQRARTLLDRTALSVAEIASEVGMDPFHLSLRFKAETGKSPREYRRR